MLIIVRPGKRVSKKKSYLINIRRQEQLQDDRRKPVVVTIHCWRGGARPNVASQAPGEPPHLYSTKFRLGEKLASVDIVSLAVYITTLSVVKIHKRCGTNCGSRAT